MRDHLGRVRLCEVRHSRPLGARARAPHAPAAGAAVLASGCARVAVSASAPACARATD